MTVLKAGIAVAALPRLLAGLTTVALTWLAQPAWAQFSQHGQKVVFSGAIGKAQQGRSVALSGDGSAWLVGGPVDNSQNGAAWAALPFTNIPAAKLIGGNNVGGAEQGFSVALSADGNTAIIGGPNDNFTAAGGGAGAAWIFTRVGDTWTQQGGKLVGMGAAGAANQGIAVALSADGNTAAVGGSNDSNNAGAVWVFTRSGSQWTQQGNKLLGSAATSTAGQGSAVALSGDGNTLLIGGPGDSSNINNGAAWVFTRSGGQWTEQAKLVGTGQSGSSQQGSSVALSADGNTAVLGAPGDSGSLGAVWVFTRSNGQWAQQGPKLVGANAAGVDSFQGTSVALSADGNTLLEGGGADNTGIGAAWAFSRNNGTWSPLGGKLVGTGATGKANQGTAVALSGDGNTALVSGVSDNTGAGAVWVFVKPALKAAPTATHDFNNDGSSDIAWRQNGGALAAWSVVGNQVQQAAGLGTVPMSWQIVGQRDFNNDGKHDLLWRDSSTGTVAIWLLNGLSIQQSGSLGAVPGNWVISGTSDFNYDGRGDILWRDSSTGAVAIWLMDGLSVLQVGSLGIVPGNWAIAATNAKGNIFWRDTSTGAVAIWQVYGFEVLQAVGLGTVPTNWVIAGVGDFDGNGSTDILWRDNSTGTVAIWLMNGYSVAQAGGVGAVPGNWIIAETGDFNDAFVSDILWRDVQSGTVAIWFMNGLQVASAFGIGTVTLDWTIQGLNTD